MTEELSPYPICIDVSNTNERPNHNNWVIPSGTNVLVDYDHIVRAAVLKATETSRYSMAEKFKRYAELEMSNHKATHKD